MSCGLKGAHSFAMKPAIQQLLPFLLCFLLRISSSHVVESFQNMDEENLITETENDVQIIHLSDENHPRYDFEAFGKKFKLALQPNGNIVSNSFKTFVHNGKNRSQIENNVQECYYLHKDNNISAAITLCNDKMHGLIFLDNYIFEITPVIYDKRHNNGTSKHFIKRNIIPNYSWKDMPHFNNLLSMGDKRRLEERKSRQQNFDTSDGEKRLRTGNPTLEAALFFDEEAYKIFAPYFQNDILQIRDMLLAYMNGVQALYHHRSAGRAVDITLIRLEIFQRQPKDLPTHGGEREGLLDSFCDYNLSQNPPGDEDPEHWDMGLYLSGLDFYHIEKGKRSGVTMGLAVVGGVCQAKYACLIAEFGVTNIFGKPYPSAGFTSVYIMAHEIGHNLGMHHDGISNDCPKEGFIMSPSRGVLGETIWSKCSADILKGLDSWASCLYDAPRVTNELDHSKFMDVPGTVWTLKKQCELLLKDQDALPYITGKEEDICNNVQCKTPHRAGFYFAGPAIEGTVCGKDKWCQGGECVDKKDSTPGQVVEGGWSQWQSEPCKSGCILKSKGYMLRRRSCNNPIPLNTNKGCDGVSLDVRTCPDDNICKIKRTVEDYASSRCKEFAKYIVEIDHFTDGLQAPHEPDRPWMGCAIFCRRKDGLSYYTPRVELNDLGIDPYFPDGTLCHLEGSTKYYCLQHHCLPENFQFNKNFFLNEDILFPQNAPPYTTSLPENLKNYLSIDTQKNPIQRTISLDSRINIPEDAWEVKDYIDVF